MKVTVGQAVVQIMVKEGITDAFGIPGAAINSLYKYMEDAPIEHYTMRHEEACVHAADGYYRASHKIAAALCTSGPAATNFVTGLYTAQIDSIPVLCITGNANSNLFGTEPFQCVDIVRIAETVCKKAYCVTKPEDIVKVMQEAFYLMREGRRGPVLVDIPINVQSVEIEFDIDKYEAIEVTAPQPSKSDIKKAVDLLSTSKAPVIIMGGGVTLSESESEVIELAEELQIPIITTYMAKGGVPIEHPLNAGHCGIQVGQPIGNKVMLESDVVLGIGCRFSDRHTGNLSVYKGNRKFIHIDIDGEQISRVIVPEVGIVSDAKSATIAILEEVRRRGLKPMNPERINDIARDRVALRRKTNYTDSPMMPHRVYEESNKGFDEDTIFTAGCGNTQIWGGQLQDINKPMRYIPSGGAGTLGYEIPAAFGAKVADPKHYSVTIVGDFGFTFLVEELAVAAAFKKQVIAIVVNNSGLGLIRENQINAFGYEYGVDMNYNQDGTIDYVKVAEGFGCEAERVTNGEDLAKAIQRAKKSNKSYVIDAICINEQMCDMGGAINAIKSFAPEK